MTKIVNRIGDITEPWGTPTLDLYSLVLSNVEVDVVVVAVLRDETDGGGKVKVDDVRTLGQSGVNQTVE